jgi:predicted small secreted protein
MHLTIEELCMSLLKPLLLLIAVLGLPLVLGACNTMEGIGKDVGAAGQKLEKEAEENKTY